VYTRLLLLLLSAPVCAATITAVTTEFPPFQSAQPQPWGIALETARQLARQNGDTLDVRFLPWARAYQMAETTPGLMIFCLARTPQREAQYGWIGEIAPNDVTVWRLASRREVSARNLGEARVWQLGATADDVKMQYLLQHRIDLLPFSNQVVLRYRSAQAGLDSSMLHPAFTLPGLSQPLYIAFSPGTPTAQLARYQASFHQLQKRGWVQRLTARYR